MTTSTGLFIARMFGVALAVRIALVLLLRDPLVGPTAGPSADDVEFDAIARNLADGVGFVNHGRPTSFRAPGWPWLLAGVYATLGTWPPFVYLLNCLLGAASCVLAYALGRELLDEKGARRAAWLTAFFLPHAWFATLYYSENLFVPLLALSAWLMVRQARTDAIWPAAAAGLVLGAAALTRPFAVLLVPLWGVLPLLAPRSGYGRASLASVAFAASAVAVIAPWTLRNQAVHGRPVLIATNGGSTFYGGNNDRVFREWRLWGSWVSTVELPGRDEIEAAPDEVSHDRVEWRLGTEWGRDNPGKALSLLPLKVLRLIFWLPDFDAGRWFVVLRAVCWGPFLVLLLFSLTRLPRGRAWLVIHAALLATAAAAMIFWGSPRFRDANAPLLMLLAAVGWSAAAREPTRPT
jgi:4-amino-4-deoxy-L-arabinose transferase-like glycosyltransferase